MKVWFRPLLLVMLLWPAVACAEEVDLELVLAMDGSGSINPAEYELQINGTIAAFYDPGVQQAILSGPTGKIAVAVLIWSDAAFPKITTGWYLLDSQRSIEGFARTVRDFHQHTGRKFGIGGGGTGIGDGVVYALGMIAGNDFDGLRRVIDVSGDGVETDPWFAEAPSEKRSKPASTYPPSCRSPTERRPVRPRARLRAATPPMLPRTPSARSSSPRHFHSRCPSKRAVRTLPTRPPAGSRSPCPESPTNAEPPASRPGSAV